MPRLHLARLRPGHCRAARRAHPRPGGRAHRSRAIATTPSASSPGSAKTLKSSGFLASAAMKRRSRRPKRWSQIISPHSHKAIPKRITEFTERGREHRARCMRKGISVLSLFLCELCDSPLPLHLTATGFHTIKIHTEPGGWISRSSGKLQALGYPTQLLSRSASGAGARIQPTAPLSTRPGSST
jgi:hypothetical protein